MDGELGVVCDSSGTVSKVPTTRLVDATVDEEHADSRVPRVQSFVPLLVERPARVASSPADRDLTTGRGGRTPGRFRAGSARAPALLEQADADGTATVGSAGATLLGHDVGGGGPVADPDVDRPGQVPPGTAAVPTTAPDQTCESRSSIATSLWMPSAVQFGSTAQISARYVGMAGEPPRHRTPRRVRPGPRRPLVLLRLAPRVATALLVCLVDAG